MIMIAYYVITAFLARPAGLELRPGEGAAAEDLSSTSWSCSPCSSGSCGGNERSPHEKRTLWPRSSSRPPSSAWSCGAACRSYRHRHFGIPVVKGPGVTPVLRLSDFSPGLKGTPGDTNVFVLEGREPGGKALLMGDTHANEPAGMLAAVIFIENAVVEKGHPLRHSLLQQQRQPQHPARRRLSALFRRPHGLGRNAASASATATPRRSTNGPTPTSTSTTPNASSSPTSTSATPTGPGPAGPTARSWSG